MLMGYARMQKELPVTLLLWKPAIARLATLTATETDDLAVLL